VLLWKWYFHWNCWRELFVSEEAGLDERKLGRCGDVVVRKVEKEDILDGVRNVEVLLTTQLKAS